MTHAVALDACCLSSTPPRGPERAVRCVARQFLHCDSAAGQQRRHKADPARAVTSTKIRNCAITSAKLSRGLNALLRRPYPGIVGPTGPTGLTGPAAALAYGFYAAPRPCIPTPEFACPAIAVVGALSRADNVSLADPAAAGRAGMCASARFWHRSIELVVVAAPDGGPSEHR
jgi:hypothetical protein